MRRLLAVLLLLSAGAFAQTTCVNCGGLTNITEVPSTSVTSTTPIILPNGTAAAPSLEWVEAVANAGIYRNTTNVYEFSIGNSTTVMRWQTGSPAVTVRNTFGFANGNTASTTPDLLLTWKAAASLQFGAADGAAAVAQTTGVQSVVAGTSNVAGARWTLRPSLGTGLAAGSGIAIQRALMLGTGTVQQSAADAFAVGQSKTLSNTSATAQAIATITLGSNAGGGAGGTFTLVCTDGTNFDSETQSFNVSFVNKATVVTVGTPAITTSTAANNSGSCTLGITAVANGNNIDIKVTPVFTTIVPTTVTLYPVITHTTNAVTFN